MSLLQLCHLAKAVVVRSLPNQGAGKNQIHSDSADILPEKAPEPMRQNSRQLHFQSKLWMHIPVRTMSDIAQPFRSAHWASKITPLPFPKFIYQIQFVFTNPRIAGELTIHVAQS